jgi:hypothetical protein
MLTAAVPQKTSYQGLLTNSAGDPVTTQTEVIFTIWDADVGGTILWAESLMVTPTDAGLFSLDLGEVHPITEAIFNGAPTYLGIKVGGDPELTDRVELVTAPHSYHSAVADSADAIADNAVTAAKILDGSILFSDIGLNGASNGQVMKLVGGNWVAADDETGTGASNSLDAADGTPADAVYVDNDGNVGIGTVTPVADLDVVGEVATQGGRVRRDFLVWNTTQSSPNVIHVKTNIHVSSNTMYRFVVEGYNYDAQAAINSEAVGYASAASSNITRFKNNNYDSGISISQYKSTDGYVVLKLNAAISAYQLGFSVSAWFVNPSGSFDIGATVYQQTGNL